VTRGKSHGQITARGTKTGAQKFDARRNRRGSAPAPALEGKPRHFGDKPQRPSSGESEPDRASKARSPTIPPKGSGRLQLYGTHAVREVLRTRRRTIYAIFATAEAAERLAPDLAAAGLAAKIVEARDLAHRLGPHAVHQGLMAEVGPLPAIDLDDIAAQNGIVLVLDQITDPHNVGAILRTAAAFGVDGLVVTERHSPEFSGIVAKAASGGLEHVPLVGVVNLARALERLSTLGYQRIGLDSQAKCDLAEIALQRPLALVLGGEGKGLRRLTRAKCDSLARLDMPGAIKSLNVSNACAVALTLVHAKPAAC
jgi:23S rRNA (guanosine2251-2'-O)-methyltransferase